MPNYYYYCCLRRSRFRLTRTLFVFVVCLFFLFFLFFKKKNAIKIKIYNFDPRELYGEREKNLRSFWFFFGGRCVGVRGWRRGGGLKSKESGEKEASNSENRTEQKPVPDGALSSGYGRRKERKEGRKGRVEAEWWWCNKNDIRGWLWKGGGRLSPSG